MCTNDNSTATTRSIVTDYFHCRLKNQTITNDRLFLIVRTIANDCEAAYSTRQPIFHFRFTTLTDLQKIHQEIAKELFNDGIITWSRIITFIAFSAILAERIIQQQQQDVDIVVSAITDWTTNFIDRDLHKWLESQNYWAGCLKIYDKTPQQRKSIVHYAGILGTLGVLTLGSLFMSRI